MSREELYRLVDTLPEAALEPAEKALQHFQIWPPQPPPEIERMREEHERRMRRPGTSGTGMGGGSYSGGIGDRMENGRFSFSRHEDKTSVIETHYFYEGHEITVTERLRIDGKMLIYATEIVGPNGKTHRQEITFDVG